jgi:hypothetical protein
MSKQSIPNNLQKQQIKQEMKESNLLITEADKGKTVVIIDKQSK